MTKENMPVILKKMAGISLYVIFALLLFICIKEKANYHMDEISTYILANNTYDDSIVINPEYHKTYDNPILVWERSMTVQDGQKFNYANVWEKQKADVHPPFYYVIIHTVSSLFPGKFSKWFAGGVNIFFALLTLFMLRKIIYKLTESEIAKFMGTCCFIFSAGGLSAMTFFRMYILTMFFVVTICYLFLQGLEKRNVRFWIAVGILSVLGTMTHYYFLIYLFFICLIFGIFLLLEKDYKSVLVFLFTMMVSGVVCILLFPDMITHCIGGGYRGVETMQNLKNAEAAVFFSRLKACYHIVDSQLFGGLFLVYMGVFLSIFILFSFLTKKTKEKFTLKKHYKWFLVGIPAFLYFFVVSKAAVYITDRYFHPIYPVLMIVFVSTMTVICKKILPNKLTFVLLSLLLGFSTVKDFKNNWFYLYRSSNDLINMAKNHKDCDCIFIVNNKMECNAAMNEAKNYHSITFLPEEGLDCEEVSQISINTDENLVLMIGENCNTVRVLEQVQKAYPHLNSTVCLGKHSSTYTYFMCKEKILDTDE